MVRFTSIVKQNSKNQILVGESAHFPPKGVSLTVHARQYSAGIFILGGRMKPSIKEVMKTGKQVVDQMDDYYRLRQEESTNAGIMVGICIVLCIVIYFISLWPR